MPVDDTAILKRAQELAAADGYSWDVDRARTARPRPALDAAARRAYLARAREQLIAEDRDGPSPVNSSGGVKGLAGAT